MQKDISTRHDIDQLIALFYKKLLEDTMLQYIFRETVLEHLQIHLHTVADFWDSILLDANNYRGNVTEKHIALDRKFPLSEDLFNRWLELWKESINELFEGEKAEIAKTRAQSMADIMLYKIKYLHNNPPS